MAFGSATAEVGTDGLLGSAFNNGSIDHISATDVAPEGKVSPRIIGGSAASTNTYPWVVLVGKDCGGALIAPTKVLTAGHCANATTVIQGRDKKSGSDGRQFAVTAHVIAPHFQTISKNPDLHFDDVAVLTLEKAVSGVTPVNLAGAEDGGLYQPGNTGTVFGWGAHSDGGHLAKATVPVVSDSCFDVKYKNDKQSPDAMKRSLFCAGDTTHDACSGDSGGPLLINGKLAGIVSGGGHDDGCAQDGYPGTYSRVSNYSKWIQKHAT